METLAQVQLQQHLNTFEADLQQRVEVLERKSREMDESIRYAGLIQQSILPNPRIFMNTFRDAFVFFQPKDIVGGTFIGSICMEMTSTSPLVIAQDTVFRAPWST